MFGRLQGMIALIVAGAGLALAAAWYIFSQGKSAGAQKTIEKHRRKADEARKKMAGVKPSTVADTVDDLRNNGF